MMCGGPSPVKPADDEAREILKTVKDALCEKTSHQGEGQYYITFSSNALH